MVSNIDHFEAGGSSSKPHPELKSITKDGSKDPPNHDNNTTAHHSILPDEPPTRTPGSKPSRQSPVPYVERTFSVIPGTYLELGSMIEVSTDVTDDPLTGVIRWIGNPKIEDSEIRVAVELDNPLIDTPLDATNGVLRGRQLIRCSSGSVIFVRTGQCSADRRFGAPETCFSEAEMYEVGSEEYNLKMFGGFDCPIVPGVVEPMNITRTKDLVAICGTFKGIQGHLNSCYLDSTLFAMFAFTGVFDSALHREPGPQDIERYVEVRDLLCHEIVNPLRSNQFVRADRVMKLRQTLGEISAVKGMTTDEMDPEEFLNIILMSVLKVKPFLHLNNGSSSYCFQLFADKLESVLLPSVQELLDQSFYVNDFKMREVPKCLLIQLPRYGKSFKMYPRVLPSLELDVTAAIENFPQLCCCCGDVAELECRKCFNQYLKTTSFCKNCFCTKKDHNLPDSDHFPGHLNISQEYLCGNAQRQRIIMDLFAVVCIETSHYVSFVKTGPGKNAPWCFFDSMADRKGEQNGHNVPEIVAVQEFKNWISKKGVRDLELETANVRSLPKLARRLLCDASLCMYRRRDVTM